MYFVVACIVSVLNNLYSVPTGCVLANKYDYGYIIRCLEMDNILHIS